ncbi:hypothetical protein [Nannocystis radixulma]|uniref:Lipoprotein n=1 Tax=Nannocystis radixulma TaxID=2995305 RepID=A0ABT5BK13_9BACT|nr:hypothetical protein [Nannocystis radixulma]MDC0674490.1 hypothetical protein [Nannocystis radixulma]
MPPVRPALLLALVLAACAHRGASPEVQDAPDPPATTLETREDAAEPAAPAPTKAGATAQVITFSGDDADPEPPTQIRSPPKRPPIPSFQLFGTRPSDGPQ